MKINAILTAIVLVCQSVAMTYAQQIRTVPARTEDKLVGRAIEESSRMPPAPYTPFALALLDPIQLPQSNWDVVGLRVNILYGYNRNVTGLDLGLVNDVYGDCAALQIGAVNMAYNLRGWQIGVINIASRMQGLQIGLINYADSAVGMQIGLINVIADKDYAFLPIFNASF